MFEAKPIEEAISEYAARTVSAGHHEAAPYNADSLAEIYAPRVQELIKLQADGFAMAAWGWDSELGTNRWHGIEEDRP